MKREHAARKPTAKQSTGAPDPDYEEEKIDYEAVTQDLEVPINEADLRTGLQWPPWRAALAGSCASR